MMLAGAPCYVLDPVTPPRAVVMVLHDHGGYYVIGKEKSATPIDMPTDIGWKGDTWVERLYDGIYVADSLAEQGYLVVVPDAPGWGENTMECDSTEWPAMIVENDRAVYRAVREQYPDIPIYATGFSMGAYRAWMLAAKEPTLDGCAAYHWMQSMPCTKDWCLQDDYVAIAATIAPRPFMLVMGTRDRLFPIADVRQCAEKLRRDNFVYRERDDIHHFGRDAYQILIEWLDNL